MRVLFGFIVSLFVSQSALGESMRVVEERPKAVLDVVLQTNKNQTLRKCEFTMDRRFFVTPKGEKSEVVVGVKIYGAEANRIIDEDYPFHFIGIVPIADLPLKLGWKKSSQTDSSDTSYTEVSYENGLRIISAHYGYRQEFDILADENFEQVQAINYVEYQRDRDGKVVETARVSCAPLMM